MSLQPQIDLLTKLGNMGEEIPGLSIDPIIENLVKKSEEIKKITESIDSEVEEETERIERSSKKAKTPEEKQSAEEEKKKKREEARKKAEEQKKKIIEEFKKNIKNLVQEKIGEIKNQYKIFKDSLKSIPQSITATLTTFLAPSFATDVTINPAVGPAEVLKAINLFTGLLNIAISAFAEMIKAATVIKFEIPQPILDTINAISTVNNLISTISGG